MVTVAKFMLFFNHNWRLFCLLWPAQQGRSSPSTEPLMCLHFLSYPLTLTCYVFVCLHSSFFSDKFYFLNFIFLSVLGLRCFTGLFPVAASRAILWLWCAGFSLPWLLLLWSTGFGACGLQYLQREGSVVAAHGLTAARGIFLDQGSNLYPPALAGGFLTVWATREALRQILWRQEYSRYLFIVTHGALHSASNPIQLIFADWTVSFLNKVLDSGLESEEQRWEQTQKRKAEESAWVWGWLPYMVCGLFRLRHLFPVNVSSCFLVNLEMKW